MLTDPGQLQGARHALLCAGWFRVAGALDPETCQALRLRSDDPGWRPLASRVGPVRMSGWYHQPTGADLPDAAATLARVLMDELHSELEGLELPARFNEISWQRHVPAEHAVTVHRDQPVYTGVIAVVTVVGSARFAIHSHRDGPELAVWPASQGDLVLLRAAGLGHPEARCPWHRVDPPDHGARQTLTFRHSLREPGWWE